MNDQCLSVLCNQPHLFRLGLSPAMSAYRLHEVFAACRGIEELIQLDIEAVKILEKKLDNAFIDVALIVSRRFRAGAVQHWKEKFAWTVSKEFVLPPGQPL